MNDKKGWGSTVAGWFIERDDDTALPAAAAGETDGLGVERVVADRLQVCHPRPVS